MIKKKATPMSLNLHENRSIFKCFSSLLSFLALHTNQLDNAVPLFLVHWLFKALIKTGTSCVDRIYILIAF